MDEDTIVPAKRLKTVLEAFRDTNAGKPLQVRRGLTFANCLHFRRVVTFSLFYVDRRGNLSFGHTFLRRATS